MEHEKGTTMTSVCQKHWGMLREEVKKQGLGEWIAPSGETAALQMADQLKGADQSKTNYDPLMASYWMILNRAADQMGPQVLFGVPGDENCIICFLNSQRTEDGRCACNQPGCQAKEPGTIPNFETWIQGESGAVTASKNYMTEKGWL